jgi:hypothetical protein
MSVEIAFPLEFIVSGTPVSLQAKRPASRVAWRERVKQASSGALPENHFSTFGPVSVTMFYFPNTAMQGDLDNIVKPVLDALCRHVYNDDHQVERVWVQKFEPEKVFPFSNPSQRLAAAIEGPKPLLFIRVTDDPSEGLR